MNNKGVTLIELLVVLALIGIVIVTAFSLLNFGYRTFNKGTSQEEIQSNLSLASHVIARNIRYVKEDIFILDNLSEDDIEDGYYYIYKEGDSIKHLIKSEDSPRDLIKSYCDSFIVSKKNKNTLEIKITSSKENQDYEIKTRVLLLNSPKVKGKATNGGSVIKYKP
ncbi:MAG: prepilin-type N-terminal cleavage/methylation domain-containing protein [Firmicutes bacterium]|nr:prepilin-type N-terminal cleavage/methylation domain-containing protein [Bacillota bacterium]